jgi:hypothetical protein
MRARVPMDVDLEDRLVLGLTPQRFGYVAVAGLGALACWHAIPVLGGGLGVLVLGAGALLGWGSWRGRGLDHWLLAATTWTLRTRRIEVDRRFFPYARLRLWGLADRLRALVPRLPQGPPPPSVPRILRPPPKVRRLGLIRGGKADP